MFRKNSEWNPRKIDAEAYRYGDMKVEKLVER